MAIVAVVFLLFGLNAFAQMAATLFGSGGDPLLLVLLQTLVGAAGIATAIGAWRARPWAAASALAYGVITGGMIISLGPMLDLEADARPGLLVGGITVLLIGVAAAWYLRRALQRTPV